MGLFLCALGTPLLGVSLLTGFGKLTANAETAFAISCVSQCLAFPRTLRFAGAQPAVLLFSSQRLCLLIHEEGSS